MSDHVDTNRAAWTSWASRYAAPGGRNWARSGIDWGMWQVPESEVGALGDLAGLDVIELGCGTAYFSSWLARRGARPVGVDVTPAQLDTARRLQREHGIDFPLIEADAEDVPLPDASFDLALSEYGASIWCEPERWIGEAARLLRPGGRLVFLCNSPLAILCSPANGSPVRNRLAQPQFNMPRAFTWPGEEGVDFHLPHGEMLRTLRRHGFEVLDLIELQAPADAQDDPRFPWITAAWARRWPAEEIWVARKRECG